MDLNGDENERLAQVAEDLQEIGAFAGSALAAMFAMERAKGVSFDELADRIVDAVSGPFARDGRLLASIVTGVIINTAHPSRTGPADRQRAIQDVGDYLRAEHDPEHRPHLRLVRDAVTQVQTARPEAPKPPSDSLAPPTDQEQDD